MDAQTVQYSPFRFLDLPLDVRLMIYEWLPLKTIHKKFNVPLVGKQAICNPEFTLAICSAPVAILATSKQVHNEAKRIIEAKKRVLKERPSNIQLFIKDLEWANENRTEAIFHIIRVLAQCRLDYPGLAAWDSFVESLLPPMNRRWNRVKPWQRIERIMYGPDMFTLCRGCIRESFGLLWLPATTYADGLGCYIGRNLSAMPLQIIYFDPSKKELPPFASGSVSHGWCYCGINRFELKYMQEGETASREGTWFEGDPSYIQGAT